MKKGITLIEVLVASAIFAAMAVALYALLQGGIQVRKRVAVEQAAMQRLELGLQMIASQVRQAVPLRDADTGFKGFPQHMEFYTTSTGYASADLGVIHLAYDIRDGNVMRIQKHPFAASEAQTYSFLEGIVEGTFSYYDEESQSWVPQWESLKRMPKGVRVQVTYQDESGRQIPCDTYIYRYTGQ